MVRKEEGEMIITLCGSVRFESEFITAARELGSRGVAVFSLAVLPSHRSSNEDWAEGQLEKTIADLVYFKKIIASEAIVVLGDGYIGNSTAREILWANMNSKLIVAHAPGDDWDDTMILLHRKSLIGRSQRSRISDLLVAQARKVFSK
jgi:hypothetical protein